MSTSGVTGGVTGSVGQAVHNALGLSAGTGFWNGAIVGGASSATAGFVGGAIGSWLNGGSFGDGLLSGLKGAGIGGLTGGITGGLIKGFDAMVKGKSNFWTGRSQIPQGKPFSAHGQLGFILEPNRPPVYYVGQFEGINIYETPFNDFLGSATFPKFGIITYMAGYKDWNLMAHEFGHILQYKKLDTYGASGKYWSVIAKESFNSARNNSFKGHSQFWTEKWANYESHTYFYRQNPNLNWNINTYPIENISPSLFRQKFGEELFWKVYQGIQDLTF